MGESMPGPLDTHAERTANAVTHCLVYHQNIRPFDQATGVWGEMMTNINDALCILRRHPEGYALLAKWYGVCAQQSGMIFTVLSMRCVITSAKITR